MSRRGTLRAVLVLALLAGAAAPAAAQLTEVELDRGPTSELYIRKRPANPEAPVLSPELKALLDSTEKKANAKRLEAIGLLRGFLAAKPAGESRAEGLFKLAELLWEESRRLYLVSMDGYERALEACQQRKCQRPPKEPRINLSEPEKLYKTLLADHPDFRRADLALYLAGFAAKEDGREAEALAQFQQVIERHPGSPLYGDAWMMVGEHHFAAEQWEAARTAYANILGHPEAATYDLAMFKTAWCDWKLGDIDKAAREFKTVLDLAVEAERGGSASLRRRRANLRDEALDYLVVVFTEDRGITAKEVYDFLAGIGGEKYSRDVLIRVADAYLGQSEYDRAADTYRFLIELEPTAISAAAWQRKIVETWVGALDGPRTLVEIEILVTTFGPGSPWAKAQRGNQEALTRSLNSSEALGRTTATNLHAEAQQREKAARKPDLKAYEQAARGYELYLTAFGKGPGAGQVRFLRGEILFFKLQRFEEAGDSYVAAAKSSIGAKPSKEAVAKDQKLKKDALLKAMAAYEKARPSNPATGTKRQLLPVDKKFAEALDLYATLFPADPELVGVIFRNGQLFYDYGEYDEAIKRFGLIVTKYPDHADAGPAGDRILTALTKANDYENIEEWARRLKKAKAFASKEQQDRLDRLIVESIGKSGEKYAAAGKYEEAATFYLRVPKEFPGHKQAPQSMMNAGVMYEKAKRPERAAEIYVAIADKYPQSELGEKAAFSAGVVYEKVVYYDRAAESYERVVEKFPKSSNAADALYNAAVLRQALGQHDKAIAHYQLYARRYKDRKDAAEVAFRIGVVYEDKGDDGPAEQAYRSYVATYGRSSKRAVEAHVRAGRLALRLGQLRRAESELEAALKLYKKASASERADDLTWAAEARYSQGELVFAEFQKVTLDVKPRALEKTLKKKTELLAKAQAIYFDVVAYQDLKWATAALYRVGQIFDGFAEALRTAPTPTGLSEADATAYREALDTYVVEIEEKAIELYSTGYKKAIEMKVYDQYTKKIREALGRLSADEYPPEREARQAERTGDRRLEGAIIKEVAR